MSVRIRHCVECPRCRTRYLAAASPYPNGSYLESTFVGSLEEYTLYCVCARPHVMVRGQWDELHAYVVSRSAHERGYGTAEEVVPARNSKSLGLIQAAMSPGEKPAQSERVPS